MMNYINIDTYDDLQTTIDDETGDLKNLHLELENLNIQFDLQLEWIDDILRNKVIAEHNEAVENIEDEILSYNEIISINFKNCIFKKLSCWNISENQILEIHITSGSIEELNLLNNKISGKFYINKQYGRNKNKIIIDRLVIKDSVFKENFKLHNAEVKVLTIEDTDFEKHADFFKSKFEQGTLEKDEEANINENDIGFKAINFKGLALFGDTEFKNKLIFKYVTFESFSHFRKAKLHNGLDLDYSNIQNEMNFFDVKELRTKEAKINTSQETYRIIKHNFEKIGNKIEANKYHALELEKKQINLKDEKPRKWLDFIVFKIHYLSSEYSTNWFLVLLWIFIVGFLSTILVSATLIIFPFLLLILLSFLIFNKTQYSLVFTLICFTIIAYVCNQLYLQNIIQNIALINITNSEFIFIGNSADKLTTWQGIVLFFNKISLGYLYYQLLISIRKDTRK